MKLRTSFFNTAVLKKDITRFAPVWGLYTVFQLLFVLMQWDGEYTAAYFLNNAPDILTGMGIVNFFYAGLCALVLFGDLFTPRLCNALHAMPMRREGWFFTHLVSGMLFCIVPNALGASVASLLLQEYCYGAFLWLAVMVLQFLFFFAMGSFCVMCSGNRLGAVTMYFLTNFFAVLVAWLAYTFYEPVLYGITLDFDRITGFSPAVAFNNSRYFETAFDKMGYRTLFKGFCPADWQYLFIAAGVGILLLALSLLIYRKRKLETAGDFISAKPAAPVFLIIYTLCAGAVMYFMADALSGSTQYVFMVIGFAIGFFTGRMLLERKVNVFRKKSFGAFGLFVFFFFCSIALTWLDPVGVTRYVPNTADVKAVSINPYEYRYYYMERQGVSLTKDADIACITQLHQELVDNRTERNGLSIPLQLSYEMKNGTIVNRLYYMDRESDAAETLKPYYSSWEYVTGTENPQSFLAQLVYLELYPNLKECPAISVSTGDSWNDPQYSEEFTSIVYTLDGSFTGDPTMTGLVQAIEKDCQEGNMAQIWDYHRDSANFGSISVMYLDENRETTYMGITVYDDCTHTVAYLKSLTE